MHFMVLVAGNDPEKSLAPFHEYECTGNDDEFVIDVDVTDEVNEKLDREMFVDSLEAPTDYHYSEKEGFKIKMKLRDYLKAKGESEAAWADEYGGWQYREDGRYYKHTNPNAQWDWYQIGGRYQGRLVLKEGAKGEVGELSLVSIMQGQKYAEDGRVDQALKKDIDWDQMRKNREESFAKDWDEKDEGHNRLFFDGREGETKEEYVARKSTFSTFAYIGLDGEWHDIGWGAHSKEGREEEWAEEFKQFIQSLPDETLLTVVDCHI